MTREAADNEGTALLHAVIDHPEDDGVRLVYADWLDEHGADPDRADFIRVQCALAHLAPDDPARKALHQREEALYAAHAARWLVLLCQESDRAYNGA